MEETNSTIYDDVFRTIQERHPGLLIPLVNEAFHTKYVEQEPVTRLPEEYQKVVSKLIADSCSVIGSRIYHLECQSARDGGMVLRMVEYDFMIGLSGAELSEGIYRIRFPSSCIFYLRHGKNTGREGTVEIELADGQTVNYQVPVIKAQEYTLEELFEKKLYICLPYYIMRYENKFHQISRSEEKTGKLLQEFDQMLAELWDKTRQDETGLYQDLLRLIRKIAEYQLRNETELKERMGNVMGGKVLELPSDKLREAREQGISQGIEQGISQGESRVNQLILALQKQGRTEDILHAASDREYQKKLFEELGIS